MEGGGFKSDSSSDSISKFRSNILRTYQHYLDRSTPHSVGRWICTLAFLVIYAIRVYLVQGFYIVSYGLGIYLINLLIGFLSPAVDPESNSDGPSLPTKGSDEFKPFMRKLPEFKFWYSITKAIGIAFVMTFFSMFDVPVFWPVLIFYWIVLFVLTMKRQIGHMIKYKYVPFSTGKQKYSGNKNATTKGEKDYYKQQFATLRSFEENDALILSTRSNNNEQDNAEELQSEFAIKVSNYANVFLLVLKIYATVRNGSIAIAASTLDSLLDLMAGGILWFTHLSMKNINIYKYPIGKLRVQPVGIIVLAAVMAT